MSDQTYLQEAKKPKGRESYGTNEDHLAKEIHFTNKSKSSAPVAPKGNAFKAPLLLKRILFWQGAGSREEGAARPAGDHPPLITPLESSENRVAV